MKEGAGPQAQYKYCWIEANVKENKTALSFPFFIWTIKRIL